MKDSSGYAVTAFEKKALQKAGKVYACMGMMKQVDWEAAFKSVNTEVLRHIILMFEAVGEHARMELERRRTMQEARMRREYGTEKKGSGPQQDDSHFFVAQENQH